MVDYGKYHIYMDDDVNEAFVKFSYDYSECKNIEEIFNILICYGLVELGYLKLQDLPWENDD